MARTNAKIEVNSAIVWTGIHESIREYHYQYEAAQSVDCCAHVAAYAWQKLNVSGNARNEAYANLQKRNLL